MTLASLNPNTSFPREKYLVSDILSFLHSKDLRSSICVSKEWHKVISDNIIRPNNTWYQKILNFFISSPIPGCPMDDWQKGNVLLYDNINQKVNMDGKLASSISEVRSKFCTILMGNQPSNDSLVNLILKSCYIYEKYIPIAFAVATHLNRQDACENIINTGFLPKQ